VALLLNIYNAVNSSACLAGVSFREKLLEGNSRGNFKRWKVQEVRLVSVWEPGRKGPPENGSPGRMENDDVA
jgi:hypothetical protein